MIALCFGSDTFSSFAFLLRRLVDLQLEIASVTPARLLAMYQKYVEER